MSGCATDGIHRQSAEQKGHHRTEEHTGKNFRIHQRHIIIVHEIDKGSIGGRNNISVWHTQVHRSQTGQTDTDLFNIRCQQSQSGQCSGTDSKTFPGCCCCISQRIERISTFAYLRTQACHFRITPCIISNRTISIRSQRYS